MTSIEFSYDPSCPFCWITSRWLERVRTQRDIDVTWVPFSLAIKNDELTTKPSETSHAASHRDAHSVLRVIVAAERQGADAGALYGAFGRKRHVERVSYDDALIAAVLEEAGLPADLAKAAHDESLDAGISEVMDATMKVVGQDVGVPIVVFRDGEKAQGYFGPVINALPDIRESLAIWDGLEKLALVSDFYELKRTRTGSPDVASTAGH